MGQAKKLEVVGKRAAIYARYSTDMQNDQSIEDQFALCKRTALRFGLRVVSTFDDRAKSGTTQFGRDGYRALKDAINNKEFDVLIVEHTDRLGRDSEQNAHIRKRLRYNGIKLFTKNGEISEIEADVNDIVSSQFIRNLVDKIKRALDARAEKGLRPGAIKYGYGRASAGVDKINDDEAKIVLRIFREYDAGLSPRKIAFGLTKDGIPSPGGGAWSAQTILSGTYGDGMLSCLLYIGISVWNTHTTAKHPDRETDTKLPVDKSEHIIRELPHLRIIPQDLWDRVQSRRKERSRTGTKAQPVSRSEHVFAGLVQCSTCNSRMKIKGKNRIGNSRVVCANAYNTGTCTQTGSYDLEVLRVEVAKKLRSLLGDDRLLQIGIEEAKRHFETISKGNKGERTDIERQITDCKVKIERCARTIVEVGDSPTMSKLLHENEVRLAALEARLENVSVSNVSLHPDMAPRYLEAIEHVADLLAGGENTVEVHAKVRAFLHRIILKPTRKRMTPQFEVQSRLMAGMAMTTPRLVRSKAQILETEGLSLLLQRHDAPSRIDDRATCNDVISLGFWPIAA
jgi:DNA invertase Pin-like site-specific DNA recombinase